MSSTVQNFLKKRLGQELQLQVEETIAKHAGDLVAALDEIIKDARTPEASQPDLHIVKFLYNFTKNDSTVCAWILAHFPDNVVLVNGYDEPVSAAEQLALIVFRGEGPDSKSADGEICHPKPQTTKGILDDLRARLFRAEPLTSMAALLKARQFAVPDTVADIGIITISVMARHNVDTGSSKLASIVQDHCVEAKLPFVEFADAQKVVKTVQVLVHLVRNADSVPLLYNQGFQTVRHISLMNKVEFRKQMLGAGMDPDDALRIHDYAERIDCRNEHQWLSLMQHRRTDFIPIVPRKVGDRGTKDKGEKASQRNLTDMFRLEDTACETCCSATSLTAYFADLMLLLRDVSLPRTDQKEKQQQLIEGKANDDTMPKMPAKGKSLLEILCLRRPDLKVLELSCSNAQTLVPYVDLINEVLQSYIRYKADPPLSSTSKDLMSVRVYNSPADEEQLGDGHQEEAYRPGNTDTEIYTSIIAAQMHPFTHFPYSLPRDTIAQSFATVGMRVADLLEAFSSPEILLGRLLQATPSSTTIGSKTPAGLEPFDPKLLHGAAEVLRRQHAAESLGLQQSDFVAITGETFFPSWFADLLAEFPNSMAVETGCRWSVATLWGYGSVESMVDNVTGEGLSFIKEQLMVRSGIEFQDVLDLVGSQFFCQDLVITNSTGSNQFKNSIQNLRLLSNASHPPFLALTEDLCFKLQSFMRLQSKLKLSIKELDTIIFSLRTREMQTVNGRLDNKDFFSISPFVINGIADIIELSKLSHLEISSLMPIWGVMDSFGKKSFFHRSFLTGTLAQKDPIFTNPAAAQFTDEQQASEKPPEYLTVKGETTFIKDHERGIGASLYWPVEYLQDLLIVTGLQKAKLSLDTLSTLYRHVMLCRILDVLPKDCIKFFKVLRQGEDGDVFQSPAKTIATVKKWKTLFERGWTVESLAITLDKPGEYHTAEAPDDTALKTTLAIYNGAKDLRKSLAFLFSGKIANEKTIVDCASHLFDGEAAKLVVEFIQGTQINSETMTVSKEDYKRLCESSISWPKQLSVIHELQQDSVIVELILTGVLSSQDRVKLLAIESSDQTKEKLKMMIRKSLMPLRVIRARFEKFQESKRKLETSVVNEEWQALLELLGEATPKQSDEEYCSTDEEETESETESRPSSSSEIVADTEDPLVRLEMQVRARRQAFVDISAPAIIEERLTNLVLNSVQDHITSELDQSLLMLLLTEVLQTQGPDTTQSAMMVLQQMGDISAGSETDTNDLDVYFLPNRTDIFRFHFDASDEASSTETYVDGDGDAPKSGGDLQLCINGISIPYNEKDTSWAAIRMSSGQPYRLQASFSVSKLRWSSSKSLPAKFKDEDLLSATKVDRAAAISTLVTRAARVCISYQLTAEEVAYFDKGSKNSTTLLGVNNVGLQASSRLLQVNFSDLMFGDLVELQQYYKLRECVGAARVASGRQATENPGPGLIKLFLGLSGKKPADALQLANGISELTGWSRGRLEAAIQSLYTGKDEASLAKIYSRFDSLYALQAVMEFDQRLARVLGGTSPLAMSTLFEICQPHRTLSCDAAVQDLAISESLQSRLTPGQRAVVDEKLAENQRRVLVAYLLQKPYITKEHSIFDADGLFEHFLIDVQMGPQLRTSRIKQSISVVQLFIQRCLLGLEKGIPKGILPREKWDWMQQYALWEAHRKMFLYPESWIEPSLRDDKSQIFDQFESSLMQKDLSIDTFMHAIQTYIYSLKEISNLEVVAYLYEKQTKSRQVVHFFGRTRSSPHSFYYRTVTTRLPDADEIFWRPWSKIDMHIPCTETDLNGNRLEESGVYLLPVIIGRRLYLFMPQITPKPQANTTAPFKTDNSQGDFASLAKERVEDSKPLKTWEITMAWTEYTRNGWTPKRVSPGSLSVTKSPPEVSEFRFDPIVDDGTKLTILVSYAHDVTVVTAGAFAFSDDQIAVTKTPIQSPWKRPFNNLFQRVPKLEKDSTILSLETALSIYTEGDMKSSPLLWIPKDLEKDQGSLRWTLSLACSKANDGDGQEAAKESSRWVGLVVSQSDRSGSRVNYFNLPQNTLLGVKWDEANLSSNMSLINLDHTFSGQLVQAAADRVEPLRHVYDILAAQDPLKQKETFGRGSYVWFHELGQPSSLYTWEIGIHAVFLAVDRFFATQQFEEALQLARLVFDPTIDSDVITNKAEAQGGSQSSSCWRFPPFMEMANDIAQHGNKTVDLKKLTEEMELAILERRSHGGLVHATARGRPQAYMKWIVMKYAEILIAAGDVHFRRGTLESLPLATQRYIEAAHVLGPEPPKVPQLGNRKTNPKTFQQLIDDEEDFDKKLNKQTGMSKADSSLELVLPFSAELEDGTKGDLSQVETDFRKEKIVCFLRTPYFCVPLNPKFRQMRSLVHERLFNIRNSRDIQGRLVSYALREPPIDPGALISLSKQGVNTSDALAMVMGDSNSPLPRQRLEVLLSRALELCNELRSFGDRFVAAVEKKEAETFSIMRAQHTTAIQNMMLQMKQNHLEEAQQTIDSLMLDRENQQAQLSFFLQLIGESTSRIPSHQEPWRDIEQTIEEPTHDDLKMTSYEKMEMDMATAASLLNIVATGIDGLVAPFCMIPQMQTHAAPFGVGVTASVGGSNISSMMQAGSAAIKMTAMLASDEGSRASRKAQLTRQLQERRLQANIRGREIKSIDKQIEIQKIRTAAALKDIELQKSEIQESIQTELWYRKKYTNEQLYGWMEKSLRTLYFQAYTLAMGAALRVESALSFQHGREVSFLKPGGYWDASHDGLHAADYLQLDLRRLEAMHMEERTSDFEITKTFSLRQVDPQALLRLRVTGSTTISLREALYDMDFPGHYMRRIRSISVSIPAVVSPYSGLNATLTLLEHKYRVSSSASTAAEYDPSTPENEESFRTDRIPTTSIAVSSGVQDAGVFELDFKGPRYMPFEGAGAISKWHLQLPTEIKRFDYETIGDVLLHVQYTALDGGPCLRAAANQSVRNTTKATQAEGRESGFLAMWDLKNDFPNEWHDFSSRLKEDGSNGQTATRISLKLGDLKDRLPFFARNQSDLEVRTVSLFSKNQELITSMQFSCPDATDGKWNSQPLGNGILRIYSDLKLRTFRNWEFSTGSKISDLENIYLIVYYFFI